MTEHVMQFFKYDHLPPHLQAVSKPFADMADNIVATIPRNPQRTIALNKLLESKDAAVRAVLAKDPAVTQDVEITINPDAPKPPDVRPWTGGQDLDPNKPHPRY
jgi:hypothetical protein